MAHTPTSPNTFPMTDESLNIAMGVYDRLSGVNKFGRNPTVDIGTEEEIWGGSVAYSFPATALITSMSQTADQAALRGGTIEIQGLNSSWELITQTKDLDATLTTNVVTLGTPLIRVFRAKVLENVVSASPIRVHNAGETVDYAVIATGTNQTTMAIYTVPVGYEAYLTNYYAYVNPATNLDPTSMPVRLWARDNALGIAKQLKHVVGLVSGGFQHTFDPYQKFTEKTDIYITATPVGKAADVSAGFDLVLHRKVS